MSKPMNHPWLKTCEDVVVRSVFVIALLMAGFHVLTGWFGLYEAPIQRGVHLAMALIITFLLPLTLGSSSIGKMIIAFVLTVLVIASQAYLISANQPTPSLQRAIMGMTPLDFYVGLLMLVLTLEGARRTNSTFGILVLVFLLYALFGPWMPGVFEHRGFSLRQIVNYQMFTTDGLYGLPLGVSATYLILFIIFGAILERSGAARFLVDLSMATTGRLRSGPALGSVSASALLGTINGTGVGNVVTSGSFTIPLMKRVGFKPNVAGAIESTASIGGQILPPIMGAGAFLMAEVLGVPYSDVVTAATVPAALYFLAVGMMVHMEAGKSGIQPLSPKEIPFLRQTLLTGIHHLLPLAAIVYMLLVQRTSLLLASLVGIGVALAMSWLRRETRMGPADILKAMSTGARNAVGVAIACAGAGIIIGVVTQTGLGLKLSHMIIAVSGGMLPLALVLTALICLILGLGLPTAAAYLTTAILGAPALIELGVSPIAAHLFIFYFAVVSGITPPVAIAAFAAAAMAGAGPMRTALTATRLGVAAYIIPFMFVYGPPLLLQGEVLDRLIAIPTACLGILMLAAAFTGWAFVRLPWPIRMICLVVAVFTIKPGITSDLVGAAGTIIFVAYVMRAHRLLNLSNAKIAGERTGKESS